MASSMLTGERRWASARKSGMTVLGKVPKPINLPSQRLENHGLDPSVEIVPKGTLTWGSRPSSAATNAWGTSSVSSPHAEGSVGSPSFASGRPSSGGSGTRPSTAGSDRSHEPVSNACGPNSRPLSASGILASSQMSAAATRPRSADTRPGSSQLSRFAESSVDNTVVWGATGTAERLGAVSSKTSGFTLSSGDFPTLGSEKNSDSQSQRGHSSQGRPSSASGASSTLKETLEPHLVVENRNTDQLDHRNVNTWKAENHPYVGDGAPTYTENWQKDPQHAQSYTNVNMPPHQFNSWHNPPFHPADGAWYRGGGPVGPYRLPGPPGTYFDPHVSARPLHNSQAVPRPEASSVVYRPNYGEPYRPHMPSEPYMGPGHSSIPLRPGPYPGPVPYEGYYGPPTGFYNSSEKGPIMAMVRPVVYNQYPSQNPHLDPGNYHARPGGYATTMNEEQTKLGQAHENQGQFRVLLKQHDGREGREAHGKGNQSLMGTAPNLERGNQPGRRQEGDWGTKNQKTEPAKCLSLPPDEAAPSVHTSSLDGQSSDTYIRNSLENSIKAADDGLIGREETTNARVRDRKQYPVTKKNLPQMEKGEGLLTEARVTDRQSDFGMYSSKEKTKSKDVTTSADQSTCMVNVPTSNEAILVTGKPTAFTEETTVDKVLHAPLLGTSENVHFQGQRRVHGVKGTDHHAKSRSSKLDNDEWAKKIPGSESSITSLSGKGGQVASALDCSASLVAPENRGVLHAASFGDGSCPASSLDTIDHKAQRAKVKEIAAQRAKQLQEEEERTREQKAKALAKLEELNRGVLHAASFGDGSCPASSLDTTDHKAQRAKVKEIAAQRAKQLQEEEEERTREQKAKALAKLEELNRRTLAESSKQKVNSSPQSSNDDFNKQQDSGAGGFPKADMASAGAPAGTFSETVTPKDDDGTRNVGNLIDSSSDVAAQHSDSAVQMSVLSQNQPLEPSEDTILKKAVHGTAPDIHDTSSKHEQSGYQRRQTIPQDRSMGEKQASTRSTGNPEFTGEVVINTSTSDARANNEENSVRQRKKNNKNARNNKNKLDEGLTNSSFPSSDTELVTQKLYPGSRKINPSVSAAEAVSLPSESLNATVVPAEALSVENLSELPDMPLNHGLAESTEESHARVSNHWKPHPHRKSAKTQQTNKPVSKYSTGAEAVIWAPVKPLNKNEPSVEVGKNILGEASYPSGKSGHDMQSGTKAKRAEMERYVPKPVAKEHFQQGNSQRNSPSQTQAGAGDMSGKLDLITSTVEVGKPEGVTVRKATIAPDTRGGENIKHNHGKISASWRQRSSETSPVEGSLSSDPVKAVQNASDQLQPSTIDSLPKRDLTHIDDGWNDVNNTSPPGGSVASTALPKNVGANRQRRQPYKAQRVPGSTYPTGNTDAHRVMTDKREIQSPALDMNDSDGGKVVKIESGNAIGEHTKPHWQPKSQAYSHHVRQGNRGSGAAHRVPAQDPEYNFVQNEHKNDVSPRTVAAEAGDARHQDSKRERKVVGDSSKGDTTVELAPVDVNPHYEQSVAMAVDHQGHYNNRFQRGQDAGHRGKDLGQDAGKRNFHMNDKRRNSPNVEYQQVGNYHKTGESYQQNPASSEGAHEGLRAPGPRFRDRGRHHPRGGGHLYGRSSGGARVSDSYNTGE